MCAGSSRICFFQSALPHKQSSCLQVSFRMFCFHRDLAFNYTLACVAWWSSHLDRLDQKTEWVTFWPKLFAGHNMKKLRHTTQKTQPRTKFMGTMYWNSEVGGHERREPRLPADVTNCDVVGFDRTIPWFDCYFQSEPGKPGAEVSKAKKTINQKEKLPIKCARCDQPVRCPNRSFWALRLVVEFWWWLVLFFGGGFPPADLLFDFCIFCRDDTDMWNTPHRTQYFRFSDALVPSWCSNVQPETWFLQNSLCNTPTSPHAESATQSNIKNWHADTTCCLCREK